MEKKLSALVTQNINSSTLKRLHWTRLLMKNCISWNNFFTLYLQACFCMGKTKSSKAISKHSAIEPVSSCF